ncbi:hypothetical protein BDZ85DRAFT_105746 [Elsinoe ampelina]|uniref:Gfo/Idh/MocA-like oxidoreductase N-terminal domain-containing protein n=1 Tax=Elsinoe ampelina TaxID=302913 RepID=A0A6A6FXW3_9PEZI|nr:hypothetical protein BDZ85DRAFT_105746 [Elsinoe ampelina]
MITQVTHIPLLNHLSTQFQITYLHDVSDNAMAHSLEKTAGSTKPKITRDVEELCTSPDVELVVVATHHAFHASQAVIALQAGKHVFIEKPIAVTLQDTDQIIAADEAAGGGKVFVGYMRRYAAAFVDAVKEIGSIDQIRYARVRDIIGPNHIFIGQSGTFPRTFDDYREGDTMALRRKTADDLKQAIEVELGSKVTEQTGLMWELLSTLGSHDLSAMRELLGMPDRLIGVSPATSADSPFWSALFQYADFAVAYESGIDQVARFDASIEIFGTNKTVKVCIDTPFIKGLPTTMVVKETLEDGSYKESTIRRTYEDPFTLEFQEVYKWVVDGKKPKTSPSDARKDVQISGMLMKAIPT